MSSSEVAPTNVVPALVIPEPCYWHLDFVADWFANRDAAAVLREIGGMEAALQMHAHALGDPEPRMGHVERFRAWRRRHRVTRVRTFHAIQSANPVARKMRWSLGDPNTIKDSTRLIRSQVCCAAAMRAPAEGESLLVIHPGFLYRDDIEVTHRAIVEVLRRCAETAAERRVRLTVETEPETRLGHRVGSDLKNLARIVEDVNGDCDRRGLPSVAAITLDLEHNLITAWGNHDEVHRDIERYGALIEHVHVVRPLDLFDKIERRSPASWRRRPGRLERMFTDSHCPGAHATIAPEIRDTRFEGLILAALKETHWKRIGVFNLEVMPPWFYPSDMLRRGSRPHEILASLRLLRKLVS